MSVPSGNGGSLTDVCVPLNASNKCYLNSMLFEKIDYMRFACCLLNFKWCYALCLCPLYLLVRRFSFKLRLVPQNTLLLYFFLMNDVSSVRNFCLT